MRSSNDHIEKYRLKTGLFKSDKSYGMAGSFLIPIFSKGENYLRVVSHDGIFDNKTGWEHVSVSCEKRSPTWEEMCKVKELFWEDEEVVLQFHPKKSEYVNNHNFCLHMWRKIDGSIETPPSVLIGINPGKQP